MLSIGQARPFFEAFLSLPFQLYVLVSLSSFFFILNLYFLGGGVNATQTRAWGVRFIQLTLIFVVSIIFTEETGQ
jgi:hypothetical protein